ncbi:MAG: hypothetical protein ABII90_07355 [Bacteroidota bacterium]
MRHIFFFIFATLIQFSFSQTPATGYHIDDVDGQTILGCSGSFFDSGGFAENC